MTRPALGLFALVLVLVGGSCKARGPAEDPGSASDSSADSSATEPAAGDDELSEICEHNYEILVARVGAGSPAVHETFVSSCRTNTAARRERLGEAAWAERKRCVLAADDADALGICDGRKPKPKPETADIASSEIDLDRLCRHLVDVIERGMQSHGTPQMWSEEDHEMLIRGCHEEFIKTQREDPDLFERQARCLLSVERLDQIEACQ